MATVVRHGRGCRLTGRVRWGGGAGGQRAGPGRQGHEGSLRGDHDRGERGRPLLGEVRDRRAGRGADRPRGYRVPPLPEAGAGQGSRAGGERGRMWNQEEVWIRMGRCGAPSAARHGVGGHPAGGAYPEHRSGAGGSSTAVGGVPARPGQQTGPPTDPAPKPVGTPASRGLVAILPSAAPNFCTPRTPRAQVGTLETGAILRPHPPPTRQAEHGQLPECEEVRGHL